MTGKRAKRKAPNGAGSIYETPYGTYRVSVTIGPKQRIVRTVKTQAEATTLLRQLLAQRDQGRLFATSRQTVASWPEHWLGAIVRHETRPRTHEVYVSVVRHHLLPEMGHVILGELRASHVYRMRASLCDRGYAPRTVNHVLVILKTALNRAVEDDLISRNPARTVKALEVPSSERSILPVDDLARLLTHSRGTRWHALWMLLAGTGMRLGEALALRWGAVAERELWVYGTRTTGLDVPPHIGPPKTRTSRRSVTLSAPIAEALKAHRAIEGRRQMATEGWRDEGLVFPGTKGSIMHPHTVALALAEQLAAIGAARITPHQLRHSYATYQLQLGTRMEVVQRVLGHSSLAMTADLYSHVLPSMQEEAAERMAELLKEAR